VIFIADAAKITAPTAYGTALLSCVRFRSQICQSLVEPSRRAVRYGISKLLNPTYRIGCIADLLGS